MRKDYSAYMSARSILPCIIAYLLLGDEEHHGSKELGLTTPDDSISSSLHVFGNVVGTGGHESELLHDPDSTGRDVFTDVAHSGDSEH
jgi:hypothetical protein